MSERFHGAIDLVPYAIAVMILRGVSLHNQAFLLFRKQVGIMSASSTVFVLLNVVLSLALIAPYGIQGVFSATAISYCCAAILNGVWAISTLRLRNGPETMPVQPASAGPLHSG